MNVYDSHRIADVLKPLGYALSDTPEDADMMVLNTCHIREKATDKVFSELGRLKEHKYKKEEETGQRVYMGVAGCVAQAEGKLITQRAPFVDFVVGSQSYHRLPEMIAKLTGAYGKKRVIDTDFPVEGKFDHLPEESGNQGPAAFLSIQEGCDKFCTFCVVPYTRGAEYSRDIMGIYNEAQRLVDNGALEITVLGQNVNAYHGVGPDGKIWSLAQLLEKLSDIKGLERLRYTTSHPRDMDDDLIEAHGNLPKLMPFLHLPVQSGSDKILEAMNRKHGRDRYFEIIKDLRKARPDISFSSDFIVGFPGESDDDFEQTMDMIRQVGFSSCYSFKYSARPGTPAANMKNLVREDIKSERLTRLQALLQEQQAEFNETFIGKTIPVLFDRKGRTDNQLHGRSEHFQAVHINGPDRLLNTIVDVKVTGAHQNSLTGDVVTKETVSSKTKAA